MMVRIFCLWFLVAASPALAAERAVAVDPDQLTFVYQELLEPFDRTDCKHEKSDVGLFEWDVYCKLGTRVHEFAVHLVLSRYGRTRYGLSAYEMLYWVTDRSQPRVREFDSTTVWFHLNQ